MERRKKLKRTEPEDDLDLELEEDREEPKKKIALENCRISSKPSSTPLKVEQTRVKSALEVKLDEEGDFFELDDRKRLQVRPFKGKLYVDIREYYYSGPQDTIFKPTKKGVFLSLDAWNKLVELVPEINERIGLRRK
eukprot:TRINITY_DN2665_c0_g1_i9.p2 TRINITY_DN2665_c0_g1~~TRINITY_DN2665_c0_g1_i9.p2  ORF type:complete len:137 (-),score=45.02 TRINITY_DN2665_c0_g1_i9:127-537(-)